jgi:hypothetical protein
MFSMQTIELVSEEQVLSAVKEKGPVIPMEVRQILKAGDSISIGATLSTLVSRGLVNLTHIKRGGSPFYYIKGQEEKLADLSKFLNEKDKKTFDILKEKKVIRDAVEEPLTRVSVRNISDFAKRMDIEVNGQREIFWRWYLTTEEDVLKILTKKVPQKEEKEEKKNEIAAEKKEDLKKEEVKAESNPAETPAEKKEQPAEIVFSETKDKKERKKRAPKETQEFLDVKEAPVDSSGQPQMIAQFNDAFINKVNKFLMEGKITVKEARQIKKGAEYDLSVEIPTPVGNVDYFCKVKSKKKCSEGDLSSAYVQGQNIRLPVLFITTGEVVKKAKEKLKSDFKGMVIKEI